MPRGRKAAISSPESSEAEETSLVQPQSSTEDENSVKTATRRPRKSAVRRRPSAPFADASNGDYTVPLNDASPSGSQLALQKRSSGFTEVDDRAEKRKRRRSTRVSFAGQPDNESTGDTSKDVDTRRLSGDPSGRDAGRSPGTRPSLRTARLSTGNSLRINAVAPAPAPAISMDVMNSNFEEWMKMATDNKINAANSWNFALIDYFHDMSLLRNTDDNSINFQKASFTLDGCVKIWTSRVDSVGTETGKLLSNLAQEHGRQQGDEEDGEEAGVDGEAQDGGKRKPKVHRTETTLVKSYSQLQVKKLDLDFAVDPLFRKTRAEFDEGGATGLLMNHLGVDSQMRVVFDSGASKITGEEDEDEDEQDVHQTVDLEHIRSALLPSLETLDGRTIAQDLAEFRFSSDPNNLDFVFLNKGGTDDGDGDASFASHRMFVRGHLNDDDVFGGFDDGDANDDFADGGIHDFFTGDQAPADDVPAGGPSGFAPFGVDDSEEFGRVAVVGGMEPFDPRQAPNERDLIMAMNVDDDQEEMLDYFNATFMKNWAGPEHWKLRRAVKKPIEGTSDAPKARREKTVFTIDFLNPAEQTAKELFVLASKPAMITLPAKSGAATGAGTKGSKTIRIKKSAKRDDHLLPDDMHFTSQQLLRLFLKPKFTLKMRRYGVTSGQLNDLGDGEVDQHFWAEAGHMGGNELDQTSSGGPIPFNTQFFHDDFEDGPGFDDDMDGPSALPTLPEVLEEEGDLLTATQGPLKRVRPEFVNYARKAKRVDVRKLKENIWRGLKIVTLRDMDPEADSTAVLEEQLTNPEQPSTFDSVIQGLRSTYSNDKMEEISTSFCFICLLHLANERGLKIEVGEDSIIPDEAEDEDKTEERRRVGDIWGLKVYRDPTAIASA